MKTIRSFVYGLVCLFIVSCGGGGSGSGGDTVNAPDSVAGKLYRLSISSGSAPFASAGTSTVSFASNQNGYALVGDGVNTVDSGGTYTYSANGSLGVISFRDIFLGNGSFALTFSSGTSGTFIGALAAVPGARQSGSFVQL